MFSPCTLHHSALLSPISAWTTVFMPMIRKFTYLYIFSTLRNLLGSSNIHHVMAVSACMTGSKLNISLILVPITDTKLHRDKFFNTALTHRRICLRIWIFEIRSEFAQKLWIDSEYFHLGHPAASSYEYITNALRIFANACQCLTNL